MKQHLTEALTQVQELKSRILEKQRFKGYSGRARALSGSLALLMGLFLSLDFVPNTPHTILWGWGLLYAVAICLNYGAVIYWFLTDPEVDRDWRRLKPAWEVFPVFIVGGIMTIALIQSGQTDLLYGTWMCLYGLANFTSRHVLPKNIAFIGYYYILSGMLAYISPWIHLDDTLYMGLVFFIGEWIGGLILHFDEHPENSLLPFLGIPAFNHYEQKNEPY